MAHSLDLFRRNLKVLMAAMTLMAMISFVLMDDTMQSHSRTLIPLVFGLLTGGAAFVWGTRSGRQNEYLAMGAVLGVVFGLVITTFGPRDESDTSTIAGLTRRDINNLKSRRQTANQIVSALYQTSHPIPKEVLERGQFMVQFYQMQMQRQLESLQFNFGREPDQDVVFGHILRQEAARLGVTVTDEAVTDFIKMICDRKLTGDNFRAVQQQVHMSDHQIYEVLRDELTSRMAADLTFPRTAATPEQRWADFRKVAVRQQIEATTIPVDAFAKAVTDPSNGDLLTFFDDHKDKNPGDKGEPGFRQPTRVRLAFLEADFEKIEATVTPPTDEEVAKYYEDNKEFYRDTIPAPDDKKESEPKEGDTEKKDTEKKDDEKKDGEKPAEPKSDEKSKPDEKNGDKPKPDESDKKPDSEKKPNDEKPKAESPKSDSSDGKCDDKDDAEKKTSDKAKPADKPADDKKADEKKDDAKSKPESKPDDKPADEKPKSDDKPDKDTEKTEPGKDDEKQPEKKPEVRYKPFEDVQEDIREQLLSERTLAELKVRIEPAIAKMRDLGAYLIADEKDPSYLSPQQIAIELKSFAKAQGLIYDETPFLSAEELNSSEEYKIGSAVDPQDAGFSRQRSTVLQRIFARGNDSTHTPELAEDPGTKNRFAYWVVEQSEAHVPKWDEPGIRQQVLKTWKLTQKARPQAEERAKALALRASSGEKSLTETLAGETITGVKDDLQLTVIEPPEFAHFAQQGATAPKLNPLTLSSQPVELSQISGLQKIDDEFLSAIDQMKVGETKVIPNADRSAFLIVQLKSREDIPAEEDAPMRKDFLDRWPTSVAADQLASTAAFPLRREWFQGLERKYGVVWPAQ